MTSTVNYSRTTNGIPCRAKCRGGNTCRCNGSGHAHHICSDRTCACHTPAAYGLEKVVLRNGSEVYARKETAR